MQGDKGQRYENLTSRLIIFIVGLLLMSLGIVLSIRADLGATPWDALHVGLYEQFGLTVGTWSVLTGVLILGAASLYLREWPQFGAYLNMLLVGLFIDLFLMMPMIVTPMHFMGKLMMFITGIVVMAYGMAFYLSARLGAGPRDSFMLAVMKKTGWKVSHVRRGMEVIVMIAAWLIGGPIHIGTLLFSVCMGTAVGVSMPQCQRFSDIIISKVNEWKKEKKQEVTIYEDFH
ncbi:YczE/YyaS/YitT family protein [Bacillus thermotolerans]|uniref:Membrane protein n=1 Tax=Bacillus thermotolerans TaxID=1221996 RepID=A0A0F5HST4_BACTR|nr:YitT family protein [Bacillus thermotolerans]KKB36366.1 membrane protein [Bacillus thermotolerans]KKB43141.1 putative membrane protein [Bacillus thermotolerans]KKB43544.1 membrane protein [Bacillus thermotolerans]